MTEREYIIQQEPELRDCMLCNQNRVCYGFVCAECIAMNKFRKDRARKLRELDKDA